MDSLQTLAGADIAHTHLNLLIGIDGVAEFKLGIAQSEAEGEQGLALEVAVGAVLHRVVEEVGQIFGMLVEGDGQFAAGVVVAKEHFCQRLTSQFATIPCLKDGIARFEFRGEGHRRT